MNRKNTFIILIFTVISGYLIFRQVHAVDNHPIPVRSIDTMKYSRDLARSKLGDVLFDQVIDRQIKQIAGTGATHVAIGTPYDKEFLPMMKRWVSSARKYGLKVWFRGNLSGWEGWFDYPKIDRQTHTKNVVAFISVNKDLFKEGDIFTSCPECENGGPGDPRLGDVSAYRKFLISEYTAVKEAFRRANKDITANYYSMNGDVAELVMDKETTKALDGIISVDHYVESPEQLSADIKEYAEKSGGKVVLGEFGAPIPDIHGEMTEEEQAEWIAEAYAKIVKMPEVAGMNYWVNTGGSAALWTQTGSAKKGAAVLTNAYSAKTVRGKVTDAKNKPVANAVVVTLNEEYRTHENGEFTIPYLFEGQTMQVSAAQFENRANVAIKTSGNTVTLEYSNPNYDAGSGLMARLVSLFTPLFTYIKRLLTNK